MLFCFQITILYSGNLPLFLSFPTFTRSSLHYLVKTHIHDATLYGVFLTVYDGNIQEPQK